QSRRSVVHLVLDGVDGLVGLLFDLRAGAVDLPFALQAVVIGQIARGLLGPSLGVIHLVAHPTTSFLATGHGLPASFRGETRADGGDFGAAERPTEASAGTAPLRRRQSAAARKRTTRLPSASVSFAPSNRAATMSGSSSSS